MHQESFSTIALDPTLAPREEAVGLGALLGLIAESEVPFPLAQVQVRATIAGDCCHTVMRQRFTNQHSVPIEAVYLFPLPAQGAVTSMVLHAGERLIRAECRDREEAKQAFEKARNEGRRAGLLTEERSDVYTMRVTNLPPQTDVEVEIEVYERLEATDGRLRWRLPTVIPPRYLPGTPTDIGGPGILPDTDRVPDASRLQPPVRLAGGTMLDLEVTLCGRPTCLACSQHAVRVEFDDGPEPGVRIAPQGSTTLDRDFVLAFSLSDSDAYASRGWTDGQRTLVIVQAPSASTAAPLPRDAVFVIDVSGSMSGPKIEAARRALLAALHGLVAGDRVSLYAFNDRLWPWLPPGELEPYNHETLRRADEFVHRLDASGGTEMLPAIEAALRGETPPGRLRTVLLITDAEVWNDDELAAAVARRAPNVRLFTLGIDTAPNAALLQRLARLGGGSCEICGPGDDIEAAVASLEARFGSPLVEGVTFEGATPAADRPLAIFAGQPLSALLEGAPSSLTVHGKAHDEDFEVVVQTRPAPFSLGPLWARERILALEDRIVAGGEDKPALEEQIRSLALCFGIVSRYTAMVAIDTQVASDGSPVEILQPVELPHLWDQSFRDSGTFLHGPAAAGATSHLYCFSMQQAFGLPSFGRGRGLRTRAQGTDDLGGRMARRQEADGSFGQDVERTAAALVALVLLGNTRQHGLRKRTVQKAAGWLARVKDQPAAAQALAMLERAEAGATPPELAEDFRALIDQLLEAGDEGSWLSQARNQLAAPASP